MYNKLANSHQSTIPIFVINLERSVERRKFMQNQFDTLQNQFDTPIHVSFFSAIDGNSQPEHPLFSRYNDQKRLSRKGYSMTRSQLGCFASHYSLWQKCVELNHPILILEDDALLLDGFADFINAIQHIPSVEFMWLTPNENKNIKFKMKQNIANTNFSIKRFYDGWGYATGYYLSPKGAKKFLDYSQEWVYNSDITMDRYWENGIDYCAIEPAVVYVRENNDSNIQMNNKKKKTITARIKREYYAVQDKIKKYFFDLIH